MVAFTTNDKQVHHGFVYLVDFAKLLPETNVVTKIANYFLLNLF